MEALFLYRSMEKQTKEQFIEKARLVHDNKYDYSKVNYMNSKTKVEIICPIHGSFFQAPIKHTSSKQGCPKCANEENGKRCRKSFEGFIKRAKSVHGNKYDYSKVNYINSSTKVEIVCPKHGSFFQSPNNHYKYGCPKCYRSLGEEKVAALLSENNIKFEEQKKFPDCVDKTELPFDFFLPENGLNWGRLRLDGKKRVAGFFLVEPPEMAKNVFYLVFLDAEHEFYPVEKKHT